MLKDGSLLGLLGSSPQVWQLAATGAGILLPSRYVFAEVKVYRDLAIVSPFGRLGILTAEQIRDGQPIDGKFYLVEASDHKHGVNISAETMAMIRSGSLAKFKSEEHFSHKHDITIDPSRPIAGGNSITDDTPPATVVPVNPTNTTPPPASNNNPVPANSGLPSAPPLVNTGLPNNGSTLPNPTPTTPVYPTSPASTSVQPLDFNVRLGYGENPFIYLMSNKPLAKNGAKFRGAAGTWHDMYQVDAGNKYVYSSFSRIQLAPSSYAQDVLIEFSALSTTGETKTYAFYLRRR